MQPDRLVGAGGDPTVAGEREAPTAMGGGRVVVDEDVGVEVGTRTAEADEALGGRLLVQPAATSATSRAATWIAGGALPARSLRTFTEMHGSDQV